MVAIVQISTKCHAGEHRKVLILGGTGRVGASTASALLRKCPDAEIILASRSTKSYEAAVRKRPELANAKVKLFNGLNKMLTVNQLASKDRRTTHKALSLTKCMLANRQSGGERISSPSKIAQHDLLFCSSLPWTLMTLHPLRQLSRVSASWCTQLAHFSGKTPVAC